MTNPFDFDKMPAIAESYEHGPRRIVPGYDASHAMAATLLADRIDARGRVLVLGAGGGVELCALGQASSWTFVGVDPSEKMLALARRKVEAAGLEDRVELIRGFIPDAPEGPFDAATCFLTLHFIPDDGSRLDALRHIRRRLTPGAPFLMINNSADKASPAFERHLRGYRLFAQRNGAPEESTASAAQAIREQLPVLSPAREEALLAEAGFDDIELFYVALMFRGWIARASPHFGTAGTTV
jgi:tRNA (cmo5U34)-methyltransferase